MSKPRVFKMHYIKTIKKFQEDKKGVAFIEFAIIFPVMLMLLYGTVETGRYIYFTQKNDIIVQQAVNLLSQGHMVTGGTVKAVFETAKETFAPFDPNDMMIYITYTADADQTGRRRVIIAPPIVPGAPPQAEKPVTWQISNRSPLAGELQSKLAPYNSEKWMVRIPGFDVYEQKVMLVVEVYTKYTPLLDLGFSKNLFSLDKPQYKYAIARPRYKTVAVCQNECPNDFTIVSGDSKRKVVN